jgi:hypothetical protein
MKLEDQVAPLKLALRMKELGFPQETCFAWFLSPSGEVASVFNAELDGYIRDYATCETDKRVCAAPTVAEMGEWLSEGSWSVRILNGRWTSGRARKKLGERRPMMGSATEAGTRARMLIAAVALGQIDLAALNSRA